ncbi:glycoside hydrolase superfamily [Xylaria bambusicola]|uniref:glycoside hydrolase superfamily n=1 Tax=Xylaria bambusicola TaxID=326684 RepID=UPI002008A66C|nr:glycoside hydrolase superfamily [Xylaria bambusicola]KAI0512962.1 glycoside hydrolase superfamily [Xylaria bambusicola]
MAPVLSTLASIASILSLAPAALAGFSASATDNISVYWGQNSANGANTQGRLKTYCDDNGINIINVSFLVGLKTLSVNFASASDKCTPIDGTSLLSCPEIEEDIKYCQKQGKTILLSIGGATYYEGGFSDASSATSKADDVWDLFGPNTDAANRPFGSAVVDGFDFDFEASTQNFVPFAQRLRDHMDADSSKAYYLSAAPQCVYPDAAMNDMLNGAIAFDWINIQFYNNFCGVVNFANPNAWNFNVWDDWAHNTSKNPNVKVLIGVPASQSAGGGYVSASTLDPIIADTKQKYSSFGGIMAWDMSQLYANSGFLDSVRSSLDKGGSSPAPTSTTTRGVEAKTTRGRRFASRRTSA